MNFHRSSESCLKFYTRCLRCVGFQGLCSTVGELATTIVSVPVKTRYIPAERKVWGDIPSRWVQVPAIPMQVLAVHAPRNPDDTVPPKEVLWGAQQRALAHDGIRLSDGLSFDTGWVRLCWIVMVYLGCRFEAPESYGVSAHDLHRHEVGGTSDGGSNLDPLERQLLLEGCGG